MSKLDEIFANKRLEVAVSKPAVSEAYLRSIAADRPVARGFRQALLDDPRPIALIAEVKKASPSQGVIRADFDPVAIAQTYDSAGATCLSVLTDERYFQGSPEFLKQIAGNVRLPILRKDFVFDRYQLWEARAWGADAVLLIVAGLAKTELAMLYEEARLMDLDVLVEVHNERETDVALALGADLIGVNNRDLASFDTDLATSERLIPRITPLALAVSESALGSHADVERARIAGARAVLIGTTFCASPDIGGKVAEVMNW